MEGRSWLMVNYPDLSNVTNSSGVEGLIALPNASYPFFWTLILAGIWVIVSGTLYFTEKNLNGRGNLLSSMAVASLGCILLAILGSLIGMFTLTTLVPVMVFGLVIIAVWIISGQR